MTTGSDAATSPTLDHAVATYKAGRFVEAKQMLDSIVATADPPLEAWVHRAGVCEQLNDPGQTVAAWKDAACHIPDHPGILEGYATALRESGDLDGALVLYTSCTELAPKDPTTWMNLGAILRVLDRHEDAVAALQKAIDLEPSMIGAHAAMIRSWLALKSIPHALQSCRVLLDLAPNDAQSHLLSANALVGAGEFELALDHLRIARRLAPNQPEIELTLATTPVYAGHFDEASRLLHEFIEAHPNEVSAPMILLSLNRRLGRHEEGVAAADELMQRHGRLAEVRVAAAQTFVAARRPERVPDVLNPVVAASQLARSIRRTALFTLAAAHDQLKQFDDAWRRYEQANALGEVSFDRGFEQELFDTVRETCTRPSLPKPAPVPDNAVRPVFIVGMPRSGTSLLEQMLDLHPEVSGAGETSLLRRMIGRLPGLTGLGGTFPGVMNSLTPDALASIAAWGRDALRAVASDSAPVITEKTPTSFLHLALVQCAFPDAHIIHCRRNPEHVCLSCYFHEFAGQHPYQYDLENLAFYTGLQERYMTHWKNELDLPVHVVEYEQLVSAPEQEMRSLLAALDLPWHEACLHVESNTRAVRTASAQQVREPIHNRATSRYVPYEHHLGPLRAALTKYVQ